MDVNYKLDFNYYDHIQALWGAYAQAIGVMRGHDSPPAAAPPPILQLRAGLAESPGWLMMQTAEFLPEPLTVAKLSVRYSYTSGVIVKSLLEIMAGEKWFDRNGEAFTLRPEGRDALDTLFANRLRWLAMLPVPDEPSTRLHQQFRQLIAASLDSPTPPGTWCLAHSRRRAPAEGDIAADMFQFVADFNAFRDDCHMAAWQPTGASGPEWESLTTISDGLADSAATLFEQLAHRGFSTADYAAVLELLVNRGWLEDTNGRYQLTEAGRAVRAEVEQLTDTYFYAPWSVLTAAEQQQMHEDISTLLNQLADVKAPAV